MARYDVTGINVSSDDITGSVIGGVGCCDINGIIDVLGVIGGSRDNDNPLRNANGPTKSHKKFQLSNSKFVDRRSRLVDGHVRYKNTIGGVVGGVA